MSMVFHEDDIVIRQALGGRNYVGLVLRNYDLESEESDSYSQESCEYSSCSSSEYDSKSITSGKQSLQEGASELKKKSKEGHILVSWYPKGKSQVVNAQKVLLHDRSFFAGELVQKTDVLSSGSQLGTVQAIHTNCHLQVLNTKQMIYNVSSQNLRQIRQFTPGTYVLLDSWIGEVVDLETNIIVRLKNGARCKLSETAAEKLTDIRDHSVEGSAFGDNDGFYPGQILKGKSSVFKHAEWLEGQQPIISAKRHFRVVVEEVIVSDLIVDWKTQGMSGNNASNLRLPPRAVSASDIERLKPLQFFSTDTFNLGDKALYTIQENDILSGQPVTPGSSSCFFCPADDSLTNSRSPITSHTSATTRDGTNNQPLPRNAVEEVEKNQNVVKVVMSAIATVGQTTGELNFLETQNQSGAKRQVVHLMKKELLTLLETLTELRGKYKPVMMEVIEEKNAFSLGTLSRLESFHTMIKHKKGELKDSIAKDVLCVESLFSAEAPKSQQFKKRKERKSSNLRAQEERDSSESDSDSDASECSSSSVGRKPKVISSLLPSHKRKRKIFGQFRRRKKEVLCLAKPGDSVSVEITNTSTSVDVMWQDGTKERGISGIHLTSVELLDDMHFLPGEFVVASNENTENVYGVIRNLDYKERTCIVRWIRQPSNQNPVPEVLNEEEVSLYDVSPHPHISVSIGETVVVMNRTANCDSPASADLPIAGQVRWVTDEGMVHVTWVDGTESDVYPQDIFAIFQESSSSSSESSGDDDIGWVAEDDDADTEKMRNSSSDGWETADEDDDDNEHDAQLEEQGEEVNKSGETEKEINRGCPNDVSPIKNGDQAEETVEGGSGLVLEEVGINKEHSKSVPEKNYSEIGNPEIDGQMCIQRQEEEGALGCSQRQEGRKNSSKENQSDPGMNQIKKESILHLKRDSKFHDENERSEGEGAEAALPSNILEKRDDTRDAMARDSEKVLVAKETNNICGDSSAALIGTGTFYISRLSGKQDNFNLDQSVISRLSELLVEEKSDDVILATDLTGKNSEKQVLFEEETSLSSAILNELQNMCEVVDEVEAAVKEAIKRLSILEEKLNDSSGSVSPPMTKSVSLLSDIKPPLELDGPASDGTENQKLVNGSDETRKVEQSPEGVLDGDGLKVPENDKNMHGKGENDAEMSTCSNESEDNLAFSMLESAPSCHHFYKTEFQPQDVKKFSMTVKKEIQLLQSSLPPGIRVKMFEDKLNLISALIEGPSNTPFEDCIFYFDVSLPSQYPKKPPVVHFHAYCPGRLNPNLYNEGTVCVSLLDTWTGKGSETWTNKSNLLQLFISIQGLILNSEPYFNEAGYDKQKGTPQGNENSRVYNETVLIKVLQSLTHMLINPPEIFKKETLDFCSQHCQRFIQRLETWLSNPSLHYGNSEEDPVKIPPYPLFPLSRGFVISAKQALKAYKNSLCVAGIEIKTNS